jgi:hypothetical protein
MEFELSKIDAAVKQLDWAIGLLGDDVLVTERYAYSTAAYAIKALAPLPFATLHRSFGPDILNAQRLAGGQ